MNKKFKKPPKIASWIYRKVLPETEKQTLNGDFDEIYNDIFHERGKFIAWLWYWWQLISFLPVVIFISIIWSLTMFKNYFKVTLRNLRKQKMYSVINISGLAIGIACSILILLWVQHELSYDRLFENSERIFRVNINWNEGGYETYTPGPLSGTLMNDYPEIISSTRMWRGFDKNALRFKDNTIFGACYGIDEQFFKVFKFRFTKGNPETAVKSSDFIIITETTANTFFGNEDPVGKNLRFEFWGNWYDFTVTGVVKDVPSNSHLQFDFLLPFLLVDRVGFQTHRWDINAYNTYTLLHKSFILDSVNKKIAGIVNNHVAEFNGKLNLQPVIRIHLYSLSGGGPITYIYIFSSIGLFLLIVACINFMNLSTARSINRAREVGLRKVVGSTRLQLIRRFFSESVILTFIAAVFAVIIVKFLLPLLDNVIGVKLSFNILSRQIILVFLIALITGLISGSYPAVYLSNFQPVKILKGNLTSRSRSPVFRKVLVVTQFIISICLIIFAAIAYQQFRYLNTRDLGFNKEHVLYMKLRGSFSEKYETVKHELLKNPDVLSVTRANSRFLNNINTTSITKWEGKTDEKNLSVGLSVIDFDFLKTFDLKMVDGRFFSKEFSTDGIETVIINETAAKLMGLESPVGQKIEYNLIKRKMEPTIVGVVKDFNFSSLHYEQQPLLMIIVDWYQDVYIKIGPDNFNGTIAFIHDKLMDITPDYPFDFSFLDEEINRLYETEQRASALIRYATFLTIFIAGIGLLGLASFSAEQRIREIGIRRVLGASVLNIVKMFNKEFTILILLANIIAWPAAYFTVTSLLNRYAYKVSISPFVFILTALFVFLLAVITISSQTIKAALSNPVESLRNE